ncbi:hypothetical protein OGAPHI_002266 [Ogataea philodendri]|uniref:Uncharacterized protein n=1 Tax=Ogataea philodendri TaxID=1378263 RepID=A0A9P8PAX4_9ASCO|nr:uncharacterized protein OGAPHI_002266 [Ogataea philodendri]KAH3668512.1 hypothetical protein OGAPHI_002266 [Ogataea philodendri]
MSQFTDIEKQAGDDNLNSSRSQPTVYHDDTPIQTVEHTDDGRYVIIGGRKYLKSDLQSAFGGTLQPGYAPPSEHKFANPAPLGLSAFALTTFVLSLINAGAMGVKTPNVVIGVAIFYGGLIQLLAGMWEMSVQNTFGAMALSSYGGFWMSFGAVFIPWFNIATAYESETELDNALGFYLLGWALFTFMLVICTMKSTVAFFSLFAFLDMTFLLLAVGKLAPSTGCTKAGGVFGVITAFIAWYNAAAGVLDESNSYITIKAVPLPKFGKKAN